MRQKRRNENAFEMELWNDGSDDRKTMLDLTFLLFLLLQRQTRPANLGSEKQSLLSSPHAHTHAHTQHPELQHTRY